MPMARRCAGRTLCMAPTSVSVVGAHEESAKPRSRAVAAESDDAVSDRQVPHGRGPQGLPHCREPADVGVVREGRVLKAAAHRFPQRGEDNDRQQNARCAHDVEGHPPAELVGDHADQREAQRGPGGRPQVEEAQAARACFRRVVIAEHGHRGRVAPRFSDTDDHSRQRHLQETGHRAGEYRGDAPHGDARGQQMHPIAGICQTRKGNGETCIGDAERESGEQAGLGVGKCELVLDRFDQHRQSRAVEVVEAARERDQRRRVYQLTAADAGCVRLREGIRLGVCHGDRAVPRPRVTPTRCAGVSPLASRARSARPSANG